MLAKWHESNPLSYESNSLRGEKMQWNENDVLTIDQFSGILRRSTVLGGKIVRKLRKREPETVIRLAKEALKIKINGGKNARCNAIN